MSHEFWEQFAKADPLWAILSDPSKRGRRWEVEPFFETGRREVSLVLYQLGQLGHSPARTSAFDFGCGVGRLTQALAEHFDSVTGVDVSETMIALAMRLNRHGERVTYVQNVGSDLARYDSESFDLVNSDIVLQHIAPEESVRYICEFVRILRPGGITVFQVPSHRMVAPSSSPLPVAMPDEAYRIHLSVPHVVSHLAAGEKATILVRLVKASDWPWPNTLGEIRIGNHWLDRATGDMLVQDDGRVPVPMGLLQDEDSLLKLEIAAPTLPGLYTCEVDAVHEGIAWFGNRGGAPIRFSVTVTGESPDRPKLDSAEYARQPRQVSKVPRELYAALPLGISEPGEFPMFGLHQDLVLRALEESGARVFLQEPDGRCAPEWVGFRYFAKKVG